MALARRRSRQRTRVVAAAAPGRVRKLFDRVASILDEARGRVVRAVNAHTVAAYWLIGREIVEELQRGRPRAEYGVRLIEGLSARLTDRYGRGFSTTNLWYFKQFFLVYLDRNPLQGILHPSGEESGGVPILHPTGGELALTGKRRRAARNLTSPGFHPNLSWSHYRALMQVESADARNFYEQEASACGWSKTQLERQIDTLYYERRLASRDRRSVSRKTGRKRAKEISPSPIDVLKDPYILEFLDLPDFPGLHESAIESAIIANLQSFLLELGKGFSFVARQKRMRFEDEDFYVDLVFYNYVLKCFVLIDLKVGKLTHQDIGQMDSYVRMFDERARPTSDNPTIGLILCSKKNEAIVRYSVLKESRQIFAAKYVRHLPTESELRRELERERRLIESRQVGGRPNVTHPAGMKVSY